MSSGGFLWFCFCFTHSSVSRSFSSLFLSLKHPREFMLSRTSGSMASTDGSLRMPTFLGTGCSGSGSFFPPLGVETKQKTDPEGNMFVLELVWGSPPLGIHFHV